MLFRSDRGAVAALPGVTAIESDEAILNTDEGGRRIVAALAPGAPAQDALKAAFTHNLDLRRFEVREPSLHDAFILLTEGRA